MVLFDRNGVSRSLAPVAARGHPVWQAGCFYVPVRNMHMGKPTPPKPIAKSHKPSGRSDDPARVVAFNLREDWSSDISHEFVEELQRCADLDHVDYRPDEDIVELYTRPESGSCR